MHIRRHTLFYVCMRVRSRIEEGDFYITSVCLFRPSTKIHYIMSEIINKIKAHTHTHFGGLKLARFMRSWQLDED